MKHFIIAAAMCLWPSLTNAQDTLRIGAWNIQDFHHEEGHSLRKFGDFFSVKRTSGHFALLEKYRDMFGSDGKPADVLALQEFGTKAALERLFPQSDYETVISPRWTTDAAEQGEGSVYTALAVRKGSGVTITT